MFPLYLSSPGEQQIVRRVSGTPEVKKHLEALGFSAGSSITLITKVGDDVIVKVKESRIAISQEMAMKIMV